MKCLQCAKRKAIKHPNLGYIPCVKCQQESEDTVIKKSPHLLALSKRDRVQHDQDTNAKDILQPFINNKPNRAFYEAYPEYRDNYFKDMDLKDMDL